MPNRCVAGGCSNVPDPSQNIGLHKFPEDNDLEKKRRRLWVAFVQTKRAKWSPAANSRLCSQHFQTEDFESPFVTIPGTDFVSRSVLRKGAVPSIHKTPEPSNLIRQTWPKPRQCRSDSSKFNEKASPCKYNILYSLRFIHSRILYSQLTNMPFSFG